MAKEQVPEGKVKITVYVEPSIKDMLQKQAKGLKWSLSVFCEISLCKELGINIVDVWAGAAPEKS